MMDVDMIAECVAALDAEYGSPDGEDENIVRIVAPIIARRALSAGAKALDGVSALGVIPRDEAKAAVMSAMGGFGG